MHKLVIIPFLLLLGLTGCSSETGLEDHSLSGFIEKLRSEGVKGNLQVGVPINDEMEFVATYVISAYTSTRILSFFQCKDEEAAERNLEESMKNPKLTGNARNGSLIMAATFYPPDDAAVEQIRKLFLAHKFE